MSVLPQIPEWIWYFIYYTIILMCYLEYKTVQDGGLKSIFKFSVWYLIVCQFVIKDFWFYKLVGIEIPW